MELPQIDWSDPPFEPPKEVMQPMLWRLAVRIWRDHIPQVQVEPSDPAQPGRRCRVCELRWPCPARGYAERGLIASCRYPTVGRSAVSFVDWFLSEPEQPSADL